MQTAIICKGCSLSKAHHARGYCTNCYHRFIVRKTGNFDFEAVKLKISATQKERRNRPSTILSELSQTKLKELYCDQGMSLGDIGKIFNCSRGYISLLMKKYKLPVRSKSVARGEAKRKGKNVGFSAINENFFKEQTPEMAYVLGFIYSDGNLGNLLDHFSISQKEPEILYKIKELMGSEHKIVRKTKQDLHMLTIGNRVMIKDLQALGITPNKSLDIKFPVLPEHLYAHFIRGYFDGDGSISFSKGWRISFVSGSKCFLEDLENTLHKHTATARRSTNPHVSSRAHSVCYFRIVDLMKLFNYFYKNDTMQKGLFLQRKYEIFKKAFDWGEKIIAKNLIKRDLRYKL